MTVEEIKLTEQKRQELRDNLRYLNAKQLDMLDEIIKTFGTHNLQKGNMTKIALKDDSVSYDCALPNGLNHSVRDLGLTFESFYNISTYRNENNGCWRVENTAELFVNRLAEAFDINW